MRLLFTLLPLSLLAAGSETPQVLLESARTQLAAGHYPEAIRFAERSAEGFRASADSNRAGDALTVAGTAQTYSANYDAAMRNMSSALALARETGDKANEVTRLNNIGNILYFQGKYGEGLSKLRTAMAIVDANPAEAWNTSRRQLTTANIAVVYQRLGQSQLALEAYLQLRAKHGSLTIPEQAQLLTNLGVLYRRLGDPFKALSAYREAQELYSRGHLRNGEIGAGINRGIALALDLHRYPEALKVFEESLTMAQASGDRRLALQATLYRSETLGRMHRDAEALAGFSAAAASAASLDAREEQWKALYALARFSNNKGDKEAALAEVKESARLIETIRSGGPASLRAGFLADKRQVYDLLIELLARAKDPDANGLLRAMEASRSRTLSTTPKLAANQTLLEYWIGDNAMAVVSLNSSGATVTFREVLALRTHLKTLQANLSTPCTADWQADAAQLSSSLAPGKWPGSGDLVVVADRELSLIPFEVLLNDSVTISYLPSASLLKGAVWTRPIVPFWQRTLLALADPAPGSGQVPGLSLANGDRRQRLHAASGEASSAADLLGGRTDVLKGREATKAGLTAGLGDGFPILHLATHAFSDPDDGQRSWILLAGPADADYDYLFPAELSGMNLKSVNLAVLSACETDAGKLSEGEGPASFARTMLGTGAHSVVASLWKADDQATAALMKTFYEELADGATAGLALARAKRKLARSRPHPFYWASFVLSGDPGVRVPLVIRWTWVASGLLTVLGVALLLVRTSGRKA